MSSLSENKDAKCCHDTSCLHFPSDFPALKTPSQCVFVCRHWWVCIFLSWLFVHYPVFMHVCYKSESAFKLACVPSPQKISMFLIPNQLSVCEWVVWICRSLLNHTTSVSYMFMTLMAEAGDCSRTGREKQTGLQGDWEYFWDWNQCAYYETGRLNRKEDEPRAWWSTVITGKLWTLVWACKHFQ